jgi:hypothetical protein
VYGKKVPAEGGYVLVEDGTVVRSVTPSEFQPTPNAR